MEKYEAVGYSQLQKYGINPLTGEACAYGMRILCDLNEDGVALLQDFFGLNPNPEIKLFPRQMNNRVNEKPSIASCMLTRGTLQDLYPFILMREGFFVAVDMGDTWQGMDQETWEEHKHNAYYKTARMHFNHPCSRQPRVGSRNVHAMTGRHI